MDIWPIIIYPYGWKDEPHPKSGGGTGSVEDGGTASITGSTTNEGWDIGIDDVAT